MLSRNMGCYFTGNIKFYRIMYNIVVFFFEVQNDITFEPRSVARIATDVDVEYVFFFTGACGFCCRILILTFLRNEHVAR